jgi:hypothetical protein
MNPPRKEAKRMLLFEVPFRVAIAYEATEEASG